MLHWTSIAVGVMAATVAAKVFAQDTLQPATQQERSADVRSPTQTTAQPLAPFQTLAQPLAVAPAPSAQVQLPAVHADAQSPSGPVSSPQGLAGDRGPSRASDAYQRRADGGPYGYDARSARPGATSRRAAPARPDWPLDQSRRFEGPRDAYGGRWIYVRPQSAPYVRNARRYPAVQRERSTRQAQYRGDQRPPNDRWYGDRRYGPDRFGSDRY